MPGSLSAALRHNDDSQPHLPNAIWALSLLYKRSLRSLGAWEIELRRKGGDIVEHPGAGGASLTPTGTQLRRKETGLGRRGPDAPGPVGTLAAAATGAASAVVMTSARTSMPHAEQGLDALPSY